MLVRAEAGIERQRARPRRGAVLGRDDLGPEAGIERQRARRRFAPRRRR